MPSLIFTENNNNNNNSNYNNNNNNNDNSNNNKKNIVCYIFEQRFKGELNFTTLRANSVYDILIVFF